MTEELVNLTYQAVLKEIENVLAEYPNYPYRYSFANPELRQKLLVYVLNRCNHSFSLVEEAEAKVDAKALHHVLEQQPEIRASIHQGIQAVFAENADWANRHIPEKLDTSQEPSHWFG